MSGAARYARPSADLRRQSLSTPKPLSRRTDLFVWLEGLKGLTMRWSGAYRPGRDLRRRPTTVDPEGWLRANASGPSSLWQRRKVNLRDDDLGQFAAWLYQPSDPVNYIGDQPLRVQINLWLFKGQPPGNRQQDEIIVRSFKFTPE